MNSTWGRGYWDMVWADLALGLLAFTAGWAFRNGRKWSWGATCLFWGAGTAMSALIVIWLLPFLLTDVVRREHVSPGEFKVYSRFVIYSLTLLAAPYVLWTMGVLPELQRPSRRTQWSWTLAGAASGLVYFCGLIYQP